MDMEGSMEGILPSKRCADDINASTVLDDQDILNFYATVDSYESIKNRCSALPVGIVDLADVKEDEFVTHIGQVSSIRTLHRNFLFLCLRTDGSLNHNRVEILIRKHISPDDVITFARNDVKLGDLVFVRGFLENPGNTQGRPLIKCMEIQILRSWRPRDPTSPDGFAPIGAFPAFECFERAPSLGPLPKELRDSLQKSISDGLDVLSPQEQVSDLPSEGKRTTSAAVNKVMPSAREESFYLNIPLHSLCRYFASTGTCKRRACAQLHSIAPFLEELNMKEADFDFGALRKEWGLWRNRNKAIGNLQFELELEKKLNNGEQEGGEGHHESVIDVRDRMGHSGRALAFAEWIKRHFLFSRGRQDGAIASSDVEPIERSNHVEYSAKSVPYVLEVAGGRGDVALQLRLAGITGTIVDPRDIKESKKHQKDIAGRLRAIENGADLEFPGAPFSRIVGFFDEKFVSDKANEELLAKTDIIIGFHPDQATESIVDCALKLKKPFAIVPCCVFSREFPWRRLKDGTEVTSYEQFITYLSEKVIAATGKPPFRDILNYNGKNLVLHNLERLDGV